MPLSNINYAAGQDNMNDVFDKVNAIVDLLNSDSGWLTATLGAGYTGTLEYRKIGSVVYLRGTIADGVGAFGTPDITTLPAGYRPATLLNMPALYYGGGNEANSIGITTSGVVTGNSSTYTNLSFDCVSFLAD